MSLMDKAFIRAYKQNSNPEAGSNTGPSDAAPAEQPPTPDTVIRRVESPSHEDIGGPAPHLDFGTSVASYSTDSQQAPLDPAQWQDQAIIAMGAMPSVPAADPPTVDSERAPEVPAPWTSQPQTETWDEQEENRDLDVAMYSAGEVAPPITKEPESPIAPPEDHDPVTNDAVRVPAAPPAMPSAPSPTEIDSDSATDVATDVATADGDATGQEFAAVWDVDRFVWPTICEQLDESVRTHFLEAGDKLFAASQEGLNVLGITSRRRGEGRSTVVLCLARAAAAHGARVAVVDGDLAKPDLGALLGMEAPCSWHDFLMGREPLSETAIQAVADNITLLPLTRTASEEAIDLQSDQTHARFREIESHFDLVLVDLGPMNAEPEHMLSDRCLDAVVLVRDLRHSTTAQTVQAVEKLHGRGIDAVGIVENFTEQ